MARIAECFPNFKVECIPVNLVQKITEYVCINFYNSMFQIMASEDTAGIGALRTEVEKSLQRTLKLIFEAMQHAGKISAYRKGLIFGTMKSIGQAEIRFSRETGEIMTSIIGSIGDEALKKPKNMIAFVFDIVGNNFGDRIEGGKELWDEAKAKKYKKLAQAHVTHQLANFNCPNMLLSCFKLLCNDFLGRMEREKNFVMSYAKVKPDLDYLTSILKDTIWRRPSVKLDYIKSLTAVYTRALLRLHETIPLAMSRKHSITACRQPHAAEHVGGAVGEQRYAGQRTGGGNR